MTHPVHNHVQFVGRPVQVLRVCHEFLWDVLTRHDMKLDPHAHSLDGARLVQVFHYEGMIWLYLEKEGWPLVKEDRVICTWHVGFWRGEKYFLADCWPSENPLVLKTESEVVVKRVVGLSTLESIDRSLKAKLSAAEQGDGDAIKAVLNLLDRRLWLLGLDAPGAVPPPDVVIEGLEAGGGP